MIGIFISILKRNTKPVVLTTGLLTKQDGDFLLLQSGDQIITTVKV
jgi:hypothetical protein